MEQHNSVTRDNTNPAPDDEFVEPASGLTDAVAQQQSSLPDGGDFSSREPVGGSKPDPVSSGPNVKKSIAGRN